MSESHFLVKIAGTYTHKSRTKKPTEYDQPFILIIHNYVRSNCNSWMKLINSPDGYSSNISRLLILELH